MHKLFLAATLATDITAVPEDDSGDRSAEDNSGAKNGKKGFASRADVDEEEDEEDDDDDRFGGKALRNAMRKMRADDGANDDVSHRSKWSAGGPVIGGEVLAIIEERLLKTSGDPVARTLYTSLLQRASQPYAGILLKWITTGELHDPYGEFLIEEAKSVSRTSLDQDFVDEYWERKYVLRDAAPARSGARRKGPEDALSDTPEDLLLLDNDPGLHNDFVTESRTAKRERGLGGGAITPKCLTAYRAKIHMAGKYVNVIRECGAKRRAATPSFLHRQPIQANDAMEDETPTIVITSEAFRAEIDAAYLAANGELLQLLISERALFLRLRSLKHHFFMDQGDSFTHFLDSASQELSKKAKHVSLTKLQSLLDLALRNPSSVSGADPYNEDVRIAISNTTLTDWLMGINSVHGLSADDLGGGGVGGLAAEMPDSAGGGERRKEDKDSSKSPLLGIEALSLDYTVKFPLSLVLSRRTILSYQLLFRHLLGLKHLEQILTTSWLEHSKSPAWRKRVSHSGVERWKARVFNLRARMLAFAQHMYAFAVFEVLENNWRKMMSRLESVRTVDKLLRIHSDFLDTCLKECMLTNSKLLKVC